MKYVIFLCFCFMQTHLAFAQSIPNGGVIIQGQVWTPEQWNAAWQSKLDTKNGTLDNPTVNGGVLTNSTLTNPTISGGTQSGSNSSSSVTTATGSNTARTLADRAADAVNVKDYGASPVASGASNKTAIAAAISQACNSSSRAIFIPAGSYNVDVSGGEILDQCAGTNNAVSIIGAGSAATVFAPSGNNNLFRVAPPAGQANNGHMTISGFRVFTSANPTSGAAIALDHTNTVFMSDLELDGTYTAIDCIDCVGMQARSLNIGGNNSTSGSAFLRFRRASNASANVNPSENFVSTSDIRAGTAGGYTNAIVISDCDGCHFTDDHIGFSSGAMVLVQPQFNASGAGTSSDQISGVTLSSVALDTSTAGQCLDVEPLAAFSGVELTLEVTGGSCANAALDGVKLNDGSWNDILFTGYLVSGNGLNGINIQAGNHITIAGGDFSSNNLSGGSVSLYIGGTSSHVAEGSGTFRRGIASVAPVNHIVVGDSADYVAIGTNDFSQASSLDVSVTSSGTHNQSPGPSTTDLTTGGWVNWVISGSGGGYFLQNERSKSLAQFTTSAPSAPNNYPIFTSQASGNKATVSAGGADGANTALLVAPGNTANLFLGNNTSTQYIINQSPMAVTSTSGVVANAGGGQASATLITTDVATIGTVASPNDSVKLRATTTVGQCQQLSNTTANSAQVFGSGTDTINGVATGTGVALAGGKTGRWCTSAAGAWFGGTLN